jgi:hypothetical protein
MKKIRSLKSRDTVPLKGPTGQITSAREWYQWTGLSKDILRSGLFIFYFYLGLFQWSSKFCSGSRPNLSIAGHRHRLTRTR